jgi:hypothetical protein
MHTPLLRKRIRHRIFASTPRAFFARGVVADGWLAIGCEIAD